MKSTIQMRCGEEGPRHDPYHYEEITVTRQDGREAMLHIGLTDYLTCKINDRTVMTVTGDSICAIKHFERFIGLSMKTIERTPLRLQDSKYRNHHRTCGNQNLESTSGYPGETFSICKKCHQVFGYHFDQSAIE